MLKTAAGNSTSSINSPRQPAPEPLRLGQLHEGLLNNLASRDPARAGDFFAQLAAVPGWLDVGLDRLQARIATDPNRTALSRTLLDGMLLRSDVSLGHLKTIAKMLELGAVGGRGDEVRRAVTSAADAGEPSPRFSNLDLLNHFIRLGPEDLQLLARLKYPEPVGFAADDPALTAGTVADRLDITPGLCDRLYAVSRCRDIAYEQWLRDVADAFAIDQVTSDWTMFSLRRQQFRETMPRVAMAGLTALLDQEALRYGFRLLRSTKETLFACFHGGFPSLYLHAFWLGAENGLAFLAATGKRIISVTNPNAALYLGVQAIQDGRPILIAADARAGKLDCTVKVLGVDVPMAAGAPFLAYETGCETVWLAVERFEKKFVPTFVPGPVRRIGESFSAFRERWFSFYVDQIERMLTGDPRNLALRLQWARLFAAELDMNQLPYSAPAMPASGLT